MCELLSSVRLFETPWSVAYEVPPSMDFSSQEYWSGSPFPSLGGLPNPGIEPGSPALRADALPPEPLGNPLWLPRWLSWYRICLQCGRPGFDPWVGKIPWRRKWRPTPVLLPGKFPGQRSLTGYSHGVTKSRTRLSSSSSMFLVLYFCKKKKKSRRVVGEQ